MQKRTLDRFDFTTVMDRTGTGARAIDMLGKPGYPGAPRDGFDAIPMWVADMNFPYPQSITDQLMKRIAHPALGYSYLREEYVEAIRWWQKTRNGIDDITSENIGYDSSVRGCMAAAIRSVAEPGEGVLIHMPAYSGFLDVIDTIGYRIIGSPLIFGEDGVWRMDLDDMEQKIQRHGIRVCIFCNPQNPVGRAWSREEIREMMGLFEKYGVLCFSDEVWSDIMLFGTKHVPTYSVSKYARHNTVTVYGTGKSFNLAGLFGNYDVIYDDILRQRIEAIKERMVYNTHHLLMDYALIGAYSEMGSAWVDALNEVLGRNARMVYDFFSKELTGVSCAMPNATYMMFIDCEEWCHRSGNTMDDVLQKAYDVGVAVQDGRGFGGSKWAFRLNHALPQARVAEALVRLKKHVFVD